MADDGIQIRNVSFFWGPEYYCQPTKSDVRFLVANRHKQFTKVRFWGTLRDLLLAGFCLLLMCSPALAQFIVTVEEPSEFIVVVEPPRDIIAVTSEGSEPVNLERTSNPNRFSFSSKMPEKETGRYAVFFHSRSCGPCRGFENKEIPILQAAGINLTSIDCTDGNSWGITRVPQFWIVDRETGKPVEKITGYTTAKELMRLLDERPAEEPVSVVSKTVYNGRPGNSHQNRGTLINHLLNEGIHAGRHTLTELSAMSDESLDALHQQEHNGTGRSSPSPVRIIQSGRCTKGNCSQQRGGLLRRLFQGR